MQIIHSLLVITSITLASGCTSTGPQSTMSERMQDNFIFTSGQKVSTSNTKCILLQKPYTLSSGKVSFSLPAGKYIGNRHNKTGVFYYAPQSIKSSNTWHAFNQQGIYLDNNANKGNLFTRNPTGYDDRPIRGVVLPNEIFKVIQRNVSC